MPAAVGARARAAARPSPRASRSATAPSSSPPSRPARTPATRRVMIAAGLLAKKAVAKGLDAQALGQDEPRARLPRRHRLPRQGRTRHAPRRARLQHRRLRLHDLHRQLRPAARRGRARRSRRGDLVVAAVLSGNRNFEGRVNPRREGELPRQPAARRRVRDRRHGRHRPGRTSRSARARTASPSILKDIWPTQQEIADTIAALRRPGDVRDAVRRRVRRPPQWKRSRVSGGELYAWDANEHLHPGAAVLRRHEREPAPIQPIRGARCLAVARRLGHHRPHQPRRRHQEGLPAGTFLHEQGVAPLDFNSYGARRGNDRVMTRGTFANIRLKNLLAPGTEGGVTQATCRRGERDVDLRRRA